MKDATAALIVLEVKRLHGETVNLEQLHAAIVEALTLHEMEVPYGTERRTGRVHSELAPVEQAAQVP